MTELVELETPRSEGAAAISENGAVSHSVEPLDDFEMDKSDDEAVSKMATAVDVETQEQNAVSCAICLSEYGMLNVCVFGNALYLISSNYFFCYS